MCTKYVRQMSTEKKILSQKIKKSKNYRSKCFFKESLKKNITCNVLKKIYFHLKMFYKRNEISIFEKKKN